MNLLRNIAMDNAKTKYIFLNDIDFEPMPKLDAILQKYVDMGYTRDKTVRISNITLTYARHSLSTIVIYRAYITLLKYLAI